MYPEITYKITRNADHVYIVTAYRGDVIIWSKELSSVTQMLKKAGIIGEYLCDDYYRDRGTRTHDGCTLVAQGWIDAGMVADDIAPFVTSFQEICQRVGLKYISANGKGYDPELNVCGEYDLIMDWNGKRTLVELKTSKFEMYHGLQLAAYKRMVDVDTVMGLELKTGKVFVPADDWYKNEEVWVSICKGTFVLEEWVHDKKRRRMNVLKEGR